MFTDPQGEGYPYASYYDMGEAELKYQAAQEADDEHQMTDLQSYQDRIASIIWLSRSVGTTLANVADIMGIEPIVAAKHLREMADSGAIEMRPSGATFTFFPRTLR